MTTAEAAKLLGIEQGSVSRLIHSGALKATRFGPLWMIDRKSVEDFQRRNEGKSKFDRTRGELK